MYRELPGHILETNLFVTNIKLSCGAELKNVAIKAPQVLNFHKDDCNGCRARMVVTGLGSAFTNEKGETIFAEPAKPIDVTVTSTQLNGRCLIRKERPLLLIP